MTYSCAVPISRKISQILKVLRLTREAGPSSLEALAGARREAVNQVATELGIDRRSVADKCWRGLQTPPGEDFHIGDFDALAWGWLSVGDVALQRRCLVKAAHEEDRSEVAAFFGSDDQGEQVSDAVTGRQIVDHVLTHLTAEGLHFEREQVADFYLCLRTKPFVLLAGISGTGKSLLPRRFAKACGFGCAIVPVRPDWSDPSDLVGYRNLQDQFVPGGLIGPLLDALETPHVPRMVVLDEMNLARVEHYFADLLSVMETREHGAGGVSTEPLLELAPKAHLAGDPDLRTRLQAALERTGGRLPMPANLSMVGTVNMDESTHPFSRKVLDRAMTMEFAEVDLRRVTAPSRAEQATLAVPASALAADRLSLAEIWDGCHDSVRSSVDALVDLNEPLKKASLHVGYRVRDEVGLYVHHNAVQDLIDHKDALDLALHHKVLPRVFGGDEIEPVLSGLLTRCQQRGFERCAVKLDAMQQRLTDSGYTSFWA